MNINLIKNPSIEDYQPSVVLLNEVFSKFPNYIKETKEDESFEKTKGKDPVILEAWENGVLVGFALGYERYNNYYHIWELGVKEEFRSQGIATALYDMIEDYANENGYLGVTLNTFNRYKANIILVIKRGYEIYDLDKREKYKDDPKIMLRKEFTS